MKIDVIDNLDAFTKLKASWDAVYEADPESQIFLSWNWMWAWFRKIDSKWSVMAAKPDAKSAYVAFLPLQHRIEMKKDGTFYNELKMGGSEFADYTGFICDPSHQDEAAAAFADRLLEMSWMRLNFVNILASDKRFRLFMKAFERPKLAVENVRRFNKKTKIDSNIYPFVKLPGDWETYCAEKLSTNTRQKAKRFLKRLDESGEFRVTHATKATIDRDIDILLKFWETKWAAQKGKTLRGILSNNRMMLKHSLEVGAAFLPVLWAGDRPLAAHGTLMDTSKRSMHFLIGGRDETYNSPPPGFMLHAYSLRWSIQNGFKIFDFLQGNEDYKYMFGAEERLVKCVTISTKTKLNLGDKLDAYCLPEVLERTTALHKEGKLGEAAIGYRQIIEADPHHTGALYLFAQLEAVRANHAAAEKLFTAYLAEKPKAADGWLRLGKVQQAQGNALGAIASLRKVLELEPANREAASLVTQLSPLDDLLSAAAGPRPKWLPG